MGQKRKGEKVKIGVEIRQVEKGRHSRKHRGETMGRGDGRERRKG